MTTAFIGLGSNVGDRWGALLAAFRALGPGVVVSSLFETAPVGGPTGQMDFLNSVARLETSLAPRALLERMLGIERELGRLREAPNGPRIIDLDLLLHGEDVVRSHEIEVPHPRMHQRGFVLAPLAELVPNLVHPVLGLTIGALYEEWARRGSMDRVVRIAGPEWAERRIDPAGRVG